MADKTEYEMVEQVASVSQELRMLDGTPFLIVPDEWRVEDLSRMLERPLRTRADVRCTRLASFAELVNEFKGDETRGFICHNTVQAGHASGRCNLDFPVFKAVIDARGKDRPARHNHTIGFATLPDPRFSIWTGQQHKEMTGREFAQFIERNRSDVIGPTASDLVTLIRNIKGKANIEFSEEIDEQTGATTESRAETIVIRGGKRGDLELPGHIRIGVPIYDRQRNTKTGKLERVALDCVLRVRVNEASKVVFMYEIDQLRDVTDQVFDDLIEQVHEMTGLGYLYASPD